MDYPSLEFEYGDTDGYTAELSGKEARGEPRLLLRTSSTSLLIAACWVDSEAGVGGRCIFNNIILY